MKGWWCVRLAWSCLLYLYSRGVSQQAKVENLHRLYEIDDHPERRAWLDKLLTFMEERGTPISQCPTISKNPLDLYRLYMFTKDRGGFVEVGAGFKRLFFFNNFGINLGVSEP